MRQIITWIAAVLLVTAALMEAGYIRYQRETINALIELNHDKSVYIDAGCPAPYKGTEEMLPEETPCVNGATIPAGASCTATLETQ